MTARDTTTLLTAVGNDRAAEPRACEMVRQMMARQVNSQRLASGFSSEVKVFGKTGTLPTVSNEAGVVSFPGG